MLIIELKVSKSIISSLKFCGSDIFCLLSLQDSQLRVKDFLEILAYFHVLLCFKSAMELLPSLFSKQLVSKFHLRHQKININTC